MPDNVSRLVVLFADIASSSDLYESLGDEGAHKCISHCVGVMANQLPPFQGTLVKTIGDEIMCLFPNVVQAFHAAHAMHHAVGNCMNQENTPMRIRVGFHVGDVIHQSGDVFGDTVNIAARVSSITRANQTIVTQTVVDALPPDLRSKTHKLERAEFKGKPAQFEIYQVMGDDGAEPVARIGSSDLRKD
jgi:adenylate cyclase